MEVQVFLDTMCYVPMGHLTNAFMRLGLVNVQKIHSACELPPWDREDLIRKLVDDAGTPVSELDVGLIKYGMQHFGTGKRPRRWSEWASGVSDGFVSAAPY